MKIYKSPAKSILIFFIAIVSFIVFLNFKFYKPQPEETFLSFCSIYIDNSRLHPNSGLTTDMVERLKIINDSLENKDSLKYVLFLSHGADGEPVATYTKTDVLVNKIYAGITEFPSIASDYDKLQKVIFKNPFFISEKIEMHYFLTDDFYNSLSGKPKNIITGLAQEIIQKTGFNKEAYIYMYYSNQTGTLKEIELKEEFEIFNQSRFKSNIKIHLIKL